ncbi:hypothetical protein J1614_002616 [Plenodomus biglobosus]|nr:hypothetical protein J1614_002616 [Plenodomus biglobosus]
MVLLSRNGAPSLLRMVGGKVHASDKDHEEPAQKKRRTDNGRMTMQDGSSLYAEPESSGDEQLRKPLPRKPKSKKPGLRNAMSTLEEEGAIIAEPLSSDDGQLRKPSPRKPKASKPGLRNAISTQEEEDAILAEPLSSDDGQLRKPSPRKPKASILIPTPQASQDDTDLRKSTARKSTRKVAEIRKPAAGSYAKGKAEKTRQTGAANKENASSSAPPSSTASVTDGGYTWSMEHSSQKSSQNARSYGLQRRTTNIHALPQKKTFGKPKGVSRTSGSREYSWNMKVSSTKEDDDSGSDVSLKDPLELSPEELDAILSSDVEGADESVLRTKAPKSVSKNARQRLCNKVGSHEKESDGLALPSARSKTRKTSSTETSKSTMLNDDELEDILKPPRVRDQLEEWMQDQPILSSQPDSSAPLEALDNLQDYIQQLPGQELEGTQCTLCKEPVQIEDYWEFWRGKEKTVKNHTAFCHAHQKKSAQDEYRKEGYPPIDWDNLSIRIRKHRMPLFQILNNNRPSTYRTRYEPLALTGKAAAVPSRRKDLPSSIQDELDSYALDDQSTYPGYYGPHGRRAITEHVMHVLKNEIKNCKDAVVQGSGPAAFVQAVLVPECAVLLIMEDCMVDRERAEEIREGTYEMGLLLNEEIEDEVEENEGERSEDENEYLLE